MVAQRRPGYVLDRQTATWYKPNPECWYDRLAAITAVLYLLAFLGFFSWMLLDTWADRNLLVSKLGYSNEQLASSTYTLMAAAAIGGSIGAIVDGLQSALFWHSQQGAYGHRFIWKDVARPWIGGALAVLVYVLLRGGLGAVAGDVTVDVESDSAFYAAFGIGSIAGFGSDRVISWLIELVAARFPSTPQKDGMPIAPPPDFLPDELLDALEEVKVSPREHEQIRAGWSTLTIDQRSLVRSMTNTVSDPRDLVNLLVDVAKNAEKDPCK